MPAIFSPRSTAVMANPRRRYALDALLSLSHSRRGATIVELVISLVTLGVLCGIAIPRIGDQLDRIAVRGAARDVRTLLSVARARAIGSARPTAVHFNALDSTTVLRRGGDTLELRALGQVYGVALRASRPFTTFGVNGLGLGGANVSVALRRHAIAETVFVSREGRVR